MGGLFGVGPGWGAGALATPFPRHDVPVAFLATDATSARAATDRGYEVLSRGVSGDDLSDALSGSQVGQVLAVDDNDAFNELILDRLVSHLDHDALYRLAPEAATDPGRGQAGLGRSPFEGIADQHEIASRMALGWSITETSAGAVPGEASLLVAIDAGTVRFRPRREVLDVSAAVVALTPP